MSIVKINALTVPVGQEEELERRFAARQHAVDNQPGFEGFQLLRPTRGEDRYFVVTQWQDEQSYQAWREQDTHAHDRPAGGEGQQPRQAVATGAQLLEFDVVFDSTRL